MAICAWLILLQPGQALAQEEISISAFASQATVPPGSGFLFTITIEASGARRLPDPEEPDFGDIQVLGKSTGQSMSISGLSMKISRTITYQLVAPEQGEHTIPPISITYNGNKYSSKPVTIKVDSSATAPQANRRGGGYQNPFGGMDPFPGQRSREVSRKDMFVTMEVDKARLWLGQQAVATFSFWRAVDLWEKPGYQKPKFEGFWVEELLNEDGNAEKTTLETLNDRKYAVSRIRYAIIPLAPGTLTVDPAVITASVDPWSRNLKLVTQPVDVVVSSLPTQGAPDDFSGMVVSSPRISLKASPSSVKMNNSLFLTFTIEGEGYLKPTQPPRRPKGDWFEAYDPKVSDELIKTGGSLTTRRIVEYPLIARREGQWTLPAFAFSWFDPETGRYERYSASPGEVAVTAGLAAPAQATPRSVVEPMADAARYIKPDMSALPDHGAHPHRQWWIWGVIASPWPMMLLAWAYRRRKERLGADTALFRATHAAQTARRRMDRASAMDDPEMFFAELDQTARGYLADKWNVPAPSVTMDLLAERLANFPTLAQGFGELLSSVEMARYARPAPERMKLLLEKARELVAAMEKEVGR